MTDLTRAVWRKSSRSGGNNGQCVELAFAGRAIRDSKNQTGGALLLDQRAADRLMTAVKAGRFG